MNQLEIGYFLKALREEKGVTQEKLAEMVGVSNRTVSRWENGKNIPDLSILMQLTELYDVKLSEIVAGKRESEDENMNKTEKQAIIQLAQSYRDEKYVFPKKLNWLLLLGAVCVFGLCLDFGENLNNICMGIIAGASLSAFLINSLYILNGKKIDAPLVEIGEKVMPCTYKDTISGVGGHVIVSAKGMRFMSHRLNTRISNFECSFDDVDEMIIGKYKMIRNLLIVKMQGKEYRFLLEKHDRESLMQIYQENRKNIYE